MQIPMPWHVYSVLWKTSGFTKWKCKWLTSLVIKGLQEPNVPGIFQSLLINRAHSQTGAQLVQRATFLFPFNYNMTFLKWLWRIKACLDSQQAPQSTPQASIDCYLSCPALRFPVSDLRPIADSQVAPTEPPLSSPKHKHGACWITLIYLSWLGQQTPR